MDTNQFIAMMTLCMLLSCSACQRADSARETEKKQDQADSVAQKNDLRPALGRFEGQILMTAAHKQYYAALNTRIVYRITPSPRDPTVNISVPKLSGYLTFPMLKNLDINSLIGYSDVTSPLGGYIVAGIDVGDYDPDTHALNLPYVVARFGPQAFGAFQGKLTEGHFIGQWNSQIESEVGTFDLVKVDQPNQQE